MSILNILLFIIINSILTTFVFNHFVNLIALNNNLQNLGH